MAHVMQPPAGELFSAVTDPFFSFNSLCIKHATAINALVGGKIDELPDNVYEDFFEHYINIGEMPYGIAKARTGDPYQWVNARVLTDLDT